MKKVKKKNAKESQQLVKEKTQQETKKKKKNSEWTQKFVNCSYLLTNTSDPEILFELLQLYTEYVVL